MSFALICLSSLLFVACTNSGDVKSFETTEQYAITSIDTTRGIEIGGGLRIDTLRVVAKNPWWMDSQFSFPLLVVQSSPRTSDLILDGVLRVFDENFRRTESFREDLSTFVFGQLDSTSSNGTYLIDFEVLEITDRTVVLELGFEWAAAYSEFSSFVRQFDRIDGRDVTLQRLLSREAAAGLLFRAHKDLITNLRDHLERLRVDSANDIDPDEIEWRREAIAMYEYCLEYRQDREGFDEDLVRAEFRLSGDSLIIIHPRCSSHALRALDELWKGESPYSLHELYPNLTPYGKELVTDRLK